MKYFDYSTKNILGYMLNVFLEKKELLIKTCQTSKDFKKKLINESKRSFKNNLKNSNLAEAIDFYGALNALKAIYGPKYNSKESFDETLKNTRKLINAGRSGLSFELFSHCLNEVSNEFDFLVAFDIEDELTELQTKNYANFEKMAKSIVVYCNVQQEKKVGF